MHIHMLDRHIINDCIFYTEYIYIYITQFFKAEYVLTNQFVRRTQRTANQYVAHYSHLLVVPR